MAFAPDICLSEFCLVDADIFAFAFRCALGRGSTTRPWVRPIFDGMSAAREESIFRKWEQHDDWPLFASRDQQIEFIELHENEEKATRIRTCRHQPGFPADKDLRTQYEWSKTWMKKRARQLAPRMDEFRASQANGPALRIRG